LEYFEEVFEDFPNISSEVGIHMMVAQGEEMEPEGEEEDHTLCLAPLRTSPPTQIVTMAAMEVSFI
jgi:hypothetical protein